MSVVVSACGAPPEVDDAGPADGEEGAPISGAPQVAWNTLVERSSRDSVLTPIEFRSSSDSLRVITELLEARSPVSTGLVISNLLGEQMVPITSIRAEQPQPNTMTIDTAIVKVPPGRMQLYIAEHRGLTKWRVIVQEPRDTPNRNGEAGPVASR